MRSNFRNRFTAYDAMEARGDFAKNPANAGSYDPTEGTSLYKGPVQYPKMFYHPEGQERVLVKGEVLLDRDGQPRIGRDGREIIVGEQKEIIWKIAQNSDEEDALRAEGWHDHPALAISAAGGEAPPMSAQGRIKELEEQLKRAQQALDSAKSSQAISAAVRPKRSSNVAAPLPLLEQ